MSKTRKPPKHLGRDGRAWFRKIVDEFTLDTSAEWELLEQAAAVLDRITECREAVKKDGLTVATGQGGVKPHPCLNAERDNRILFARLCRELRLCEPAAEESRIPKVGMRKR
jgi:P27 family predicted phage terminase small subunit